jgi:NhaA family Na+:H+ antiporter
MPLDRTFGRTRTGRVPSLRAFFATELAGGVVLLVATAVAVVWANSPWSEAYATLWHTTFELTLGSWQLSLDLRSWVNDGLMALFFLVVGLEIKRELLQGELRDRRRAALPIAAALGGMVVPALLYTTLNLGGHGAAGWGIPMATDIAFALGVLAIVAPRAPTSLRLFLLALAIVDDVGAILVIAIFYSDDVDLAWLAVAALALAAVYGLRRLGVHHAPAFVVLGVLTWLALHSGGVHATLAGVAMGLLAPATPRIDPEVVQQRSDEMLDVSTAHSAKVATNLARQSVSVLEWLEYRLHPWTSLAIVPLFALANAGVKLTGDSLTGAVTSPVTLGVVLGLSLGKPIGIAGGAWLACRTRLATRDPDLGWRLLIGAAALGGIGFTVSLFITDLAFGATDLADEAKVGVLGASVLASCLGAALLRPRPRRP